MIHNLTTLLYSVEEIHLLVNWDLEVENDIPASRHDDNFSNATEEYRSVHKIHSVKLVIYDKTEVDVTGTFLSNKELLDRLEMDLLNEIQYDSIEELTNVAA